MIKFIKGQNNTNMNSHPHSLLDKAKYTSAIRTSDEFRKSLPTHNIEEMTSEEKRTMRIRAVARGALDRANQETKESGYRTPDGDIFNLIANLDTFYEAQQSLAQLDSDKDFRHVARSERIPYLKDAVQFNHALREVIDNHPSLSFTDILNFMTEMHTTVSGPDTQKQFYTGAREVLDGMRHEIGFEQILGALPDLDYREASIDEDINGADIIVTVDNTEIPVDIKGSPRTTAFKREKSYHPERIIWSQLSFEDFNGGMRISRQLAEKKAPALRAELERAAIAERAA